MAVLRNCLEVTAIFSPNRLAWLSARAAEWEASVTAVKLKSLKLHQSASSFHI